MRHGPSRLRDEGKTKGQAQRRAPHRPACSPGRSGTAAVATVDWEWPIRVSPPAHRGASYVGQRDSDGPSTHGLRQGGSHRSRVQGDGSDNPGGATDVPSELIEAQLAHAVGDALGRAYNRTKFLEQRRRMMVTWAKYLEELRDRGPSSSRHASPHARGRLGPPASRRHTTAREARLEGAVIPTRI